MGWQVKDGVLVCEDPHNASDVVTREEFDWFELHLEYNISPAGNSGIRYRPSEIGTYLRWLNHGMMRIEERAIRSRSGAPRRAQ